MPQIGPAEILVILLVGLLVFGPSKLPEIGRQVGRGLHELRKFQDTIKGELDGVLHYDEDTSSAAPSTNGSTAMTAGEAPPALPPVEAETPPAAPKPPPRAPSRFRAPGPPSTT